MHPGLILDLTLFPWMPFGSWRRKFQPHGFWCPYLWGRKERAWPHCVIYSLFCLLKYFFFLYPFSFYLSVLFLFFLPLGLDFSFTLFCITCLHSWSVIWDHDCFWLLYPLNHSFFFLYVQGDLRTIENYFASHSCFIIQLNFLTKGIWSLTAISQLSLI